MIASVLFDLDGTLIDSRAGIEYAAQQAVDGVLPGRQLGSLQERIGPPMRTIFLQSFPDLDEAVLGQLEAGFRKVYDYEGWALNTVYPGVRETLTTLADGKVRCFVVTYKPSLPTGQIMQRSGLSSYFVEVLSPDSRSPRFANKQECIRDLLERHCLAAEQTLLVGDTENDGLAAQECGLRFVLARYGYGRMDDLPCAWATIDAFADLLGIVLDNSK